MLREESGQRSKPSFKRTRRQPACLECEARKNHDNRDSEILAEMLVSDKTTEAMLPALQLIVERISEELNDPGGLRLHGFRRGGFFTTIDIHNFFSALDSDDLAF